MHRFQRINLTLLLTLALVIALAVPAFAAGQNGTTLSSVVTTSAIFERDFSWTIAKSVTPEVWNLFVGDSGTSQYTVTLAKDSGTDYSYMTGEISVYNGGAVATANLYITVDVISPPSATILNSAIVDISSNPVIAPYQTCSYPYTIAIPNAVAGATYKVISHVTILNHSGSIGTPKGPNTANTAVFPVTPNKLVNDTVNVTDTNGLS
jgi:hypothetical protein